MAKVHVVHVAHRRASAYGCANESLLSKTRGPTKKIDLKARVLRVSGM